MICNYYSYLLRLTFLQLRTLGYVYLDTPPPGYAIGQVVCMPSLEVFFGGRKTCLTMARQAIDYIYLTIKLHILLLILWYEYLDQWSQEGEADL